MSAVWSRHSRVPVMRDLQGRRGSSARILLAIGVVLALTLAAPATSAASSELLRRRLERRLKVFFSTTSSWSATIPTTTKMSTSARAGRRPWSPRDRSTATAMPAPSSLAPPAMDRRFSSPLPSRWSAATPTAAVDIYERSGGTTTQVSQGQINGNGAFFPFFAEVSTDGSKVFFFSDEQLVSGDIDSQTDIYERSGGTTTQVSQGADQRQRRHPCPDQFITASASSDGSKVFFTTAEPLVSGDTDSTVDIYERSGGTTTQVSQGADQRQRLLPLSKSPRLERRLEGLLPHHRAAGQRRHRRRR